MDQADKAQTFRKLHVPGTPVVLYNIWDAGSARAVAAAGAQALATGSWSVAGALGYADGQALPLDVALQTARSIVAASDLPVSVDFEGGYAVAPEAVGANVARLIETGAVGLNLEDQVIGGTGLHGITLQCERIAAARAAARAAGVPLVINARTDLFLKEKEAGRHPALLAEALSRAAAYAGSGADCVFVPGLADPALVAEFCAKSPLPVNVMHSGDPGAIPDLAAAGAARISHGPKPWRDAMAGLTAAAQACYAVR